MDPRKSEDIKSEQRQENIEERMFDIAFRFEGNEYQGWARASQKKIDAEIPVSYHVVLNGIFFGNLSYNDGQWESDTQRERKLIQKVGEEIAAIK